MFISLAESKIIRLNLELPSDNILVTTSLGYRETRRLHGDLNGTEADGRWVCFEGCTVALAHYAADFCVFVFGFSESVVVAVHMPSRPFAFVGGAGERPPVL